jgi:hypothetical protein
MSLSSLSVVGNALRLRGVRLQSEQRTTAQDSVGSARRKPSGEL